jgi:hypothetical protein
MRPVSFAWAPRFCESPTSSHYGANDFFADHRSAALDLGHVTSVGADQFRQPGRYSSAKVGHRERPHHERPHHERIEHWRQYTHRNFVSDVRRRWVRDRIRRTVEWRSLLGSVPAVGRHGRGALFYRNQPVLRSLIVLEPHRPRSGAIIRLVSRRR